MDSKPDNITTNTPQLTGQEDTLRQMSEKFKHRLTRLKNTTTKLFEKQENDNDLVHDRIIQIEDTPKEIQTSYSSQNITRPKRLFSDDSISDDTPIHKQPDKPKSKSFFYSPQSNMQQNKYSKGSNMEYLRKNVHMICSDQDQILEFYIKLRLAIAKGGIFIKPIDDINKKESIVQDTANNADEREIQLNTLYSLLSNEKFIPNDFVMAQNCLLAYASSMDGFGALKAMLKLTHPTLTMKRQPSTAPMLTKAQDIHR